MGTKSMLLAVGWFLAAAAPAAQRGALDYQSQPEAETGTRQPTIVWRFQAAGPIRNALELHDGVIYASSADGRVHALAADNGLPLWDRDLGSAAGAPVASGDLLVLIDRRNRVHALERTTGDTRWTAETGADLELHWGREGWDYLTPAPVIHEEVVYAGSGDGGLYALEAADGAVRWIYRTGGRIRAAPALHEGTVYVGSGDGYFHAVDAAAGERVWRFRTEGAGLDAADFGFDRTQITGAASVADDAVYFGSRDARLYALDRRSGRELWRFEEPSAWVIATPAVTADGIYSARSSSSNVRAIDRGTGEELWVNEADGFVFASPAVVGDRLYVGSDEGTLHAFDRASGGEAWSLRTAGGIWGTPVAHAGRLYFAGDDGAVYAVTDHAAARPAFAVFWDESLLPRSSQAAAPAEARELVAGLVSRGYQVLNRPALQAFLEDPGLERIGAVLVIAADGLPSQDFGERSRFARFLSGGGTLVWLGRPPGMVVRDESGAFQRLDEEIPSRLLGVPVDTWNGDRYPAMSTAAGKRRGLPAFWTATPAVSRASPGMEVLASDDFGRPAAWVRHFGGRAGSGFVYLGDPGGQLDACAVAAVAGHGLSSGGFAAGAPACGSD